MLSKSQRLRLLKQLPEVADSPTAEQAADRQDQVALFAPGPLVRPVIPEEDRPARPRRLQERVRLGYPHLKQNRVAARRPVDNSAWPISDTSDWNKPY